MRRAARVDANHADIVNALRACGALVLSLASVGNGCPDLLVLSRGRLYLFEVKDGAKTPGNRKLDPKQIAFHREWPVTVVLDAESALAAICNS